jgi:myo-inositol-1(or 4)-monophosphatase
MLSSRPSTPSLETQHRFDALAQIAECAEIVALDFFKCRGDLIRENKSSTDFVSEADRAVERCIRSQIAKVYPDDLVVGEELGGEKGSAYWLIDPIDGTSNFLSGLPLWAISIAYVEDGRPTLGAVSIPLLSRCLVGGLGHPLQDIGRSQATAGTSLVFGIGKNEHWPTDRRDQIEALLHPNGLTALTLGSCATSLALVASGELAGYAEGHVGFWDIAAGVALCEAANVPVSFAATAGKQSSFVAAGPASVQKDVFNITCLKQQKQNTNED